MPPAAATARIPDKNLRIFHLIRDDAPKAKGLSEWPEMAAWNWVVLYARKFPTDVLEKNARKDVTFADLFQDGRRDLKLDLVRFEGNLIRLSKVNMDRRMRDAGVEFCYEGWLVPTDEPRANPVCVVLTELPEGLEPAHKMSQRVSFAGYSFKLLQYESAERDKNDRPVWKRAPLLIGRSVTLKMDPEYAGGSWSAFFVPMIITGFAGIVGLAALLSWHFRRGDAQVKKTLAGRQTNPFGN